MFNLFIKQIELDLQENLNILEEMRKRISSNRQINGGFKVSGLPEKISPRGLSPYEANLQNKTTAKKKRMETPNRIAAKKTLQPRESNSLK